MTFIFDIDGTLADCSQRLKYILPPEDVKAIITDDGAKLDWDGPDWETFHKECVNDSIIPNVVNLLNTLKNTGYKIILVTGRPESSRDLTIKWLKDKAYLDVSDIEMYMREDGDHRPDYVIKKEIYNKYLKDIKIYGVFEDRKQCVDMWRSLGLTCYQVADGDY